MTLRPILALALVSALGCSSGSRKRVEPPTLSPSGAAEQALAEYDANKDGFLDEKELEKCPPLKAAHSAFDKDKDGRISKAEIADRLQLYRDSRIGLVNVAVLVQFNGRPLGGATVRLVPEPFQGPAYKPASGTTEPNGTVTFQSEGTDLPGVACGLYRVEVTKPGGPEKIPAKYNDPTTLGIEIAPDMHGLAELKLTSR